MRTTRRHFLSASAATVATAATVPSKAQAALRGERWMPKLSENLADVKPDTLRWLKQLGCKHVIFQGTDNVDLQKKGFWNVQDVQWAKKSCDDAGMILESMMIPIDFYKKARFGQKGRDEEI